MLPSARMSPAPKEPSPRYHLPARKPWVVASSISKANDRDPRGKPVLKEKLRLATVAGRILASPYQRPGGASRALASSPEGECQGQFAHFRVVQDITQFENPWSALALACASRETDGGRLPWSLLPYDAYGNR